MISVGENLNDDSDSEDFQKFNRVLVLAKDKIFEANSNHLIYFPFPAVIGLRSGWALKCALSRPQKKPRGFSEKSHGRPGYFYPRQESLK